MMTGPDPKDNLDGMTPEGLVDYWKDRARRAETKLADVEDVKQAKLRMMHRHGWSEPDAFRWIQQYAMNTRRSAGDVARRILDGTLTPEQPDQTMRVKSGERLV